MSWKRALVTGASSGIGREIAVQLAGRGTHLVLVARSADVLDALASQLAADHGVDVEVLPADLTDAGELSKVEERVRDLNRPVDLVVNNAGFGTFGRFHELDVDREEAMVALNVIALTRLTHAAVARMVAEGRGGILNVSSMTSFQPLPYNATYAATKAYVTSFGEAIHEELRGTGVHVTTLCPGFTRTEFQERADIEESRIPGPLWMETAPVARAGIEGVDRNRALVVPGAGNKVAATVSTLTPNSVLRRAAGTVIKRF